MTFKRETKEIYQVRLGKNKLWNDCVKDDNVVKKRVRIKYDIKVGGWHDTYSETYLEYYAYSTVIASYEKCLPIFSN